MISVLLALPILFCVNNAEFINKVAIDYMNGAVWTKIEPKEPDPLAKSITLQCVDHETGEACGKPYVIYKLVIPKKN